MILKVFLSLLLVYGTAGKMPLKSSKNKLPCAFEVYDLNSDGRVQRTEFLFVARGHIEAGMIFESLDMNHDGEVELDEYVKMYPQLRKEHLFNHCTRKGCSHCFLCCIGKKK